MRAIMSGAHTIEDLHKVTGTGGGCGGFYCSNTMFRLLEAAGYPQGDTTKANEYQNYHPIKPLLFTLPENIMQHDPRINHDIEMQKHVQWNPEEVEAGNEKYRQIMKERKAQNG